MNIAIIGASGFVGINLTKYLLKNTTFKIIAVSNNIENIIIEEKYKDRVNKIKADILIYSQIKEALIGADFVFYLVHMMASNKDNFYEKETTAAQNVGKAISELNIKRVIYMSGLGSDKEKLSQHLLSRHNTGNILREYCKEVIEFRASMIIGEGSISFEIVRNIVEKSPIIILPKWSKTKTQPIGLSDVLLYLREALDVKINKNEIIEIGGEEVITYENFIRKYSKFRNKNNIILRIPILSEKIAGLFIGFFTSKDQSDVGQIMLSSFKNEMIVTNNRAKELFPNIYPHKIEDFFN